MRLGHVHPKGGCGESFFSPSFRVAPEWIAIWQLCYAPLNLLTPSPSTKSADNDCHSVARAPVLLDSQLSALPLPLPPLPPPPSLSVVTRGSGGPGAAGLERAPLRA